MGMLAAPRMPTTAAAIALVDHPAEQEVAEVDEEEHRGGGESGIPRPPRAPRRLAPDGAGGDGDAGEDHSRLGRGKGETVPARSPSEQVADAADEYEGESKIGGEDGGHVEVHDALDVALHDLARGVAEGGDETGHEAEHGEPAENADGHQPSSTNSKVSTPITR